MNLICFVVGPYLISFSFLDFSHGSDNIAYGINSNAYYYYYKDNAKYLFAIGVSLVCFGFLRKYWLNKRK